MKPFALLILAGGRAERMGGIVKGHLRRPDGRTILGALLEDLGPLAREQALVATAARHAELELPAAVRRIVDLGQGPAAALIGAASQLEQPWVLAVGADQARASPASVAWLRAEVQDADPALVAAVDGGRQPLLALYARSALAAVGPGFEGRSLMALLDRLGARSLRPPAELEADFSSINTWEDAGALDRSS
ncbi:MAG: NTP transferase domain-containing protein [Myxococcota bacterium]